MRFCGATDSFIEPSLFTYDRNGNQLTQTTGSDTKTLTYDAFNHLVRVESSGMVAVYNYRADGLLAGTTKTIVGSAGSEFTTTYVWERGNIILQLNDSGAVFNRFNRGIGHLISSYHHGFYLFNMRGDVVQRVDNNGVVIHTYRYDAFGNQLNDDAVNTNPFRFNGEYYCRISGFIYMRARFMNPVIGRFISEDPYWTIHNMQSSVAAKLQAGNLYVFVMNNPVMWIDPTGLWSKPVHERLTRDAISALSVMMGRPELSSHAEHIVRGNLFIDTYPHWGANFLSRTAQSRHFNTNATGTDSRIVWGEIYLETAIATWLLADELYGRGDIDHFERSIRHEESLFILGRGLHSLQDIDAHLDFGARGRESIFGIVTGHVVQGEWWPLTSAFDNPRYEVFRDSAGNWQARDSGSAFGSTRYTSSLERTETFLNRFYTGIGMW